MAKTKTYDHVLAMKAKAVRFVRDVLEDDDRADEIEDETPEEYAERKGIRIVENPSDGQLRFERSTTMPTKEELEERVAELEEENATLNDKLDSILTIAGCEPELEDDDGEQEDDESYGEGEDDEDGDDEEEV